MKRVLSLLSLFALSMPFAFAACSRDDASANSGVPGSPDDAAAADAARTDGPPVGEGGEGGGSDGTTVKNDAANDGPAPHTGPLVAYVSGSGASIGVFGVDETTGAFSAKTPVIAFASNPSFLAVDPQATRLYAVAEVSSGRVGAYSISTSGTLTFLNDVSSEGRDPAHVSVDATGKHVFVANYGDGQIAVLPVIANGLGAATDKRFAGNNAHMIVADSSNKFVFVPCLGDDLIAQYKFEAATGKLTPNTPPSVATANNAGPRHIAFNPTAPFAYVINEKDSTMNAYAFDTTAGTLTEIDSKSTLPTGFSGNNSTAEVWVHPSGKFVYGSNRGDDSIVVFSLDAAGKMTLVAHTGTGGSTPRSFTIDPAGNFLFVANQGTSDVSTFAIDQALGTLTPKGTPLTFTSPSFVGVVRLP